MSVLVCRLGPGVVAETGLQGAPECRHTCQVFQGKAVGVVPPHVQTTRRHR